MIVDTYSMRGDVYSTVDKAARKKAMESTPAAADDTSIPAHETVVEINTRAVSP